MGPAHDDHGLGHYPSHQLGDLENGRPSEGLAGERHHLGVVGSDVLGRLGNHEVLGVQIASAEASNLLAEAALAMQLEMTAEERAETIHAHPTMPESMREAAEGILGMPIDWMG